MKLFILFLSLALAFFPSWGISDAPSSSSRFHLHDSDHLHFGRLWSTLHQRHEEHQLYEMISLRKAEIVQIKEHWRAKIEGFKSGKDHDFYALYEKVAQYGNLIPVEEGCGSAYFLLDDTNTARFVIKPIDEDILCLNNRKFYASPYNDSKNRTRDFIPLYHSAQREALSYAVAELLHYCHITPQTVMGYFKSENFYDMSDVLQGEEKELFLEKIGPPDKEKLCSIQKYVPNLLALFQAVEVMTEKKLSDEQVLQALNQTAFEDAMIFIWLIYDNDAHSGNVNLCMDESKEEFLQGFSILKLDNGLTFPQKNHALCNSLAFFPNAELPLSSRAKQQIQAIPICEIVELIKEFELDDTIEAFLERMQILNELIQRENITIAEIDLRLYALELPEGKEIALNSMNFKELESYLYTLREID